MIFSRKPVAVAFNMRPRRGALTEVDARPFFTKPKV
mgnify:CR=1 FL=1